MRIPFNITKSSRRVKPNRLLLYGLAFFCVMWIIAPVEPASTLTVDAVLYLVVSIMMWFLGCSMPFKKSRFKRIEYKYSRIKHVYRVVLGISFVAVCFRLIDLLVVRNSGIGLDSFEDNMSAMADHESNWFSIIVAVLYFVPYIPVVINMIFPVLNSKMSKIIAFALFCCIGVGALITGSRNAFLDPLLLFLFLFVFTRKKINIRFKHIVISVLLAGSFLLFSSVLFIQRLTIQNKTVFDSVESIGGFADKVPPKAYYTDLMSQNSDNPVILGLLYAYAQTTQYAIHGLWEFPICKKYIDDKDYCTYGAATFWVFDKFLWKLGIGIDPSTPLQYNARPGIWATFFLEWYMDYRYWGILFIFLLGVFIKWIWCKVCYSQNIFYLPLLMFFMLVFMYVMQLNRIVGTGSYAFFSFFVFAISWLMM